MDKLKQYLRENREAMDMDQPGVPVWENIQAAAPVIIKGSPVVLFYRYAAVIVVVLGLAVGTWLLFQNKPVLKNADGFAFTTPALPARKGLPEIISPVTPPDLPITPEEKKMAKNNKPGRIDPYELLGSFSNNYAQLVKLQLKSIRSTPVWGEEPAYFSDFKSSLEQMDADEVALRSIIKRNGLDEHLLEQVINIYQQKLDLLKTLKLEISKINRMVKPENTDSLKSYFINI